MRSLSMLKVVLILNVLTMLLQALFAGRMLGGDDQSANLHEFRAKVLVIVTASQVVRTKKAKNFWALSAFNRSGM
jgi:uncharacterized protein YueI